MRLIGVPDLAIPPRAPPPVLRTRRPQRTFSRKDAPSLKITQIEVISLRHEYPAGQGFQFAGGYCNGRLSCLVLVHTDAGLTGLGSVYSHPGLVTSIIEDHLQPLLLHQDPLQVEQLWDRCYGLTRWYGRKGVAVSALGGIDTALWDIRGKAVGKPIFELLGGNRTYVPAYASALLWKDDPAELGREAARHLAEGFRGVKMRLGRSYDYDRTAVRIVRDAIGPHNRLIIEGNARYNLSQAERIAADYRAAGVFWLEEPFLPEDIDSYLALRPNVGLPLAAGENEFGVQGFRELLGSETRGHRATRLQPDRRNHGMPSHRHAGRRVRVARRHTHLERRCSYCRKHARDRLARKRHHGGNRSDREFIDR